LNYRRSLNFLLKLQNQILPGMSWLSPFLLLPLENSLKFKTRYHQGCPDRHRFGFYPTISYFLGIYSEANDLKIFLTVPDRHHFHCHLTFNVSTFPSMFPLFPTVSIFLGIYPKSGRAFTPSSQAFTQPFPIFSIFIRKPVRNQKVYLENHHPIRFRLFPIFSILLLPNLFPFSIPNHHCLYLVLPNHFFLVFSVFIRKPVRNVNNSSTQEAKAHNRNPIIPQESSSVFSFFF
jgi:hypothetical protein